jgi:uncharacterized protein (TIGR00369 family)
MVKPTGTVDPRGYPELREVVSERIPFNRWLGIRAGDLREGFARLELPFRPELIGDWVRPALHGGVISALIDTAGGVAAMTLIPPRGTLATIDLRVDYLRPGEMATLVCESTVTRMGNRVASVDSRVFHPHAPDRLIATGKAVYNVRRAREGGSP